VNPVTRPVAPSTLERAVCALWSTVLNRTNVAAADTFVGLGGDHDSAVRLVAEVRAVFGVELPERLLLTGEGSPRAVAQTIAALRRRDPARMIRRRVTPDPAPLSFGQQRIWALQQLLPASTAYHVALAFQLDGEINDSMLERAFRELITRHEALRTRIPVRDGVPAQSVTKGVDIWLRLVEVDGGMPAALEIAHREVRRPFDLEQGPLTRALLIRTAPAAAVLVLSFHHLIIDGWSATILLQELSTLYNSYVHGSRVKLPPLPVRYRDFAIWQREWMVGARLSQELLWWGNQLRDLPADLPLDSAHDRPLEPTMAGRALRFDLTGPALQALRQLARDEHTTLFTVLLAGCQGVLAYHTGLTDIVVGTPIVERTQPEVAGVVGFFINTISMRTDCTGDPDYRMLVRRAHNWAVAAYAHHEVPFDQVVKQVAPNRPVARNSLAQVLVQLEAEDPVPTFVDVSAVRLDNLEGGSRADLEVHFRERPDKVTCEIVYAIDTIGAATAVTLTGMLHHLFERAARAPEQPLSGVLSPSLAAPFPGTIHRKIDGTMVRERVASVRHELTECEASEAWSLADSCRRRYGMVDNTRFQQMVSVIAQELPLPIREVVNRYRLADDAHSLVITGFQVDEERLEPTPPDWREADTDGSRTYGFLLVLCAALLGDAIGWATQQGGRIVTDILPIPGMEDSTLSAGSEAELTWHTEDAFSPFRADHVALLCLRNPDRTPTTVTYLDHHELPPDVLAVLREPRFHVLPDGSHTAGFSALSDAGDQKAFEHTERLRNTPPPVPVVQGSLDAPVLRIDRDFMVPVSGDQAARRALRALVDQLDRNVYELPLGPGDVCFLDNRNVAHGRRPFVPRYDGGDRWFKRVNTVRDLRRTRAGRVSSDTRVIG
jgi:Fe(II)/alpha-ketoglutarate-dependent arginine beta-hydroxylase